MTTPRYHIGQERKGFVPLYRIDYDEARRRKVFTAIGLFDSRAGARRVANTLRKTAKLAAEADALMAADAGELVPA